MHTSPSSSPGTEQRAANTAAFDRFMAALERGLHERRFFKLVLAGYRGPEAGLRRLSVRAIELRGQPHLSFVFSHETRDITKNWPADEGLRQLRELLGPAFANAHLHTADGELQLALSRKGRFSLRVSRRAGEEVAPDAGTAPDSALDLSLDPALNLDPDLGGATHAAVPGAEPAAAAHNRSKPRLLSLDRPFLAALGVTDAAHRLVPAMARKWKQINRFLEIVGAALAASPLATRQRIEVLDFGAGKGYLSFALHDHLRHTLGLDTQLTGVDLRQDMVALCSGIAARLQLEGLRFEQGDVESYAPRAVDVMIALHACDTATDHAIHYGIRGGAALICCAPCCHKQLRPQLLSPHPLRPILQHGVHLGQQAEMLTDGLRAMLLEACGYTTQVFEFVSLEHTAKNKMILAVKRAHLGSSDEVLAQVREIKAFYGIRDQCLETLLKGDALLSS